MKPVFKKISWAASIKDGVLIAPKHRIKNDISRVVGDHQNLRLTIEEEINPKTYPQLKVFHGAICEQVQSYYLETEGVFKSLDKIKYDLKEQFLIKEKKYYNDGSPVMLRLPHPERRGVFFEWHLEETPSLSTLSMEQMNSFINSIIDNFVHEKGWSIIINPKNESHEH